jgi:hypothetical protein
VEILLRQGYIVNEQDFYGFNALYHAIPNIKIIRMLLEHEPLTQVQEAAFEKALYTNDSTLETDDKRIEPFELLVCKGGGELVTKTVVSRATSTASARIFDWLLEQNPELPITQDLLESAAQWSNVEVTKYLLEQDEGLVANENVLIATAGNYGHETLSLLFDHYGKPRVPLMVLLKACSNSGMDTLECIFEKDPLVGASYGQEALRIAATNRNCKLYFLSDPMPKFECVALLSWLNAVETCHFVQFGTRLCIMLTVS